MMKGQKGITLVALIITIIVMLILVGVSISVALNGGLFTKANDAVSSTKRTTIEEAMALARAEYLADYYAGDLTAYPTASTVLTKVNAYLDTGMKVTLNDSTNETAGKYVFDAPAGVTLTNNTLDLSNLTFAPSGT